MKKEIMFTLLVLLFSNRRKNDSFIFKNKSENKKNDIDILVNFHVNMRNIKDQSFKKCFNLSNSNENN